MFAISQAGTVTLYVGFSAFIDALQSQLNVDAVMTGFFARGGYDSQSNTFTATHISVHLK